MSDRTPRAAHLARLAAYREGEPFERARPGALAAVSDVVLVAAGEQADRLVTKLGVPPCSPAHLPWPITATGEPRVFFGQACFADSLDPVGDLPGDVLLVFTHGEHDHTSGEPYFEWHPLGIEEPVAHAEVPDTLGGCSRVSRTVAPRPPRSRRRSTATRTGSKMSRGGTARSSRRSRACRGSPTRTRRNRP